MDGRTVGTDWYGTIRGTDFWSEILGRWSGTGYENLLRYGFWYRFKKIIQNKNYDFGSVRIF